MDKKANFAPPYKGRTFFNSLKKSGYSAARLAHLLWEQGVAGSNPAAPTT